MINAKVIADSENQFGNRITTLIVTMPRYILAEFNTHRMLSKNSASSRAIPFEKNLKSIQENPFIPIAWMKDHKGMQGTEFITKPEHISTIEKDWLDARDYAIKQAEVLSDGFHEDGEQTDCVTKQIVNRLLEPFMWHTIIVTGTEWENFFALRCPKYTVIDDDKPRIFRSKKDLLKYYNQFDAHVDTGIYQFNDYNEINWLLLNKGQADIHMMATAEAIWDALNESTPKELKEGQWHIPFGDQIDIKGYTKFLKEGGGVRSPLDIKRLPEFLNNFEIKIATARCARVSYTVVGEEESNRDSNDKYTDDLRLHDRLAKFGHWSPFEHCAKAMDINEYTENTLDESYITNIKEEANVIKGINGNFRGFIQYRKMFNNENITK